MHTSMAKPRLWIKRLDSPLLVLLRGHDATLSHKIAVAEDELRHQPSVARRLLKTDIARVSRGTGGDFQRGKTSGRSCGVVAVTIASSPTFQATGHISPLASRRLRRRTTLQTTKVKTKTAGAMRARALSAALAVTFL